MPAPFVAIEDRRLAGLHDVLRSAHRRGIQWDDLAGDQPIEQHPHGGELLHVRHRMRLLAGFDVARHVDWADPHQCEAALIAPGEKLLTCAHRLTGKAVVGDARLLSSALTERLQGAGVDRQTRGMEGAI